MDKRNKLNKLTVIQLKDLLRKNNISGYSNKNKQSLIDMVISNNLSFDAGPPQIIPQIIPQMSQIMTPLGTPRIPNIPIIPQITKPTQRVQIAPPVQPPQTKLVPLISTGPAPPLPSKPAPSVSPTTLFQQRFPVPDKIDYTLPFESPVITQKLMYPNIPIENDTLTARTLAKLKPLK